MKEEGSEKKRKGKGRKGVGKAERRRK